MSYQNQQTRIRNRKTKMEIIQLMKDYLESENPLVFNKSSMLDSPWNLDPRTVDEFLEIIYFCQNMFPRIRISIKNGKKIFQKLDYQELKQEMQNLVLENIPDVQNSFDLINPKVYPVFKCKECGIELGYPSHHNEPMTNIKMTGKLICSFRECDFNQLVPEHHDKKMEIFVKYASRNQSDKNEQLI